MSLDDIGVFIEEVRAAWQVPGVAIAVVQGDEVLLAEGYGYRDQKKDEPVDGDTLFAIASVTKAFTAMGVALLVDEGRLEWDKPVRDYLPYFRLADDYVGAHLTVRDLLCHRSGLPRHDLAWYGNDFSREDLVRNLAHLRLSRGLREAYQYQNIMYVTAGWLTSQIAGMAWEDFIQARIFEVLGMERTCFDADVMQSRGNYALPYRLPRGAEQVEEIPFYANAVMGPAGSIHASVNDMVKWLRVHLNGGRLGDMALVSPANLTQMHQPHTLVPVDGLSARLMGTTIEAYGLGWRITPYRGYTMVGHGGAIDGFRSQATLIPERGIGVVVLCNIDQKPVPDVIALTVLDRLLGLEGRDWQAEFWAIETEVEAAQGQNEATLEAERVQDAPHTHPLEDYAGEYEADGYADFRVKLEDDALYGWLGGQWWPLQHYHYNIFLLDFTRFQVQFPISFHTNVEGRIASLAFAIEPTMDEVTFKRKPMQVDARTLAALAGVYDMPFEGLELLVRAHGDQLYLAMTGQSETELIPDHGTAEGVEFRIKADMKVRVEFLYDNDVGYHVAVLKQPGAVFKAPRKP